MIHCHVFHLTGTATGTGTITSLLLGTGTVTGTITGLLPSIAAPHTSLVGNYSEWSTATSSTTTGTGTTTSLLLGPGTGTTTGLLLSGGPPHTSLVGNYSEWSTATYSTTQAPSQVQAPPRLLLNPGPGTSTTTRLLLSSGLHHTLQLVDPLPGETFTFSFFKFGSCNIDDSTKPYSLYLLSSVFILLFLNCNHYPTKWVS